MICARGLSILLCLRRLLARSAQPAGDLRALVRFCAGFPQDLGGPPLFCMSLRQLRALSRLTIAPISLVDPPVFYVRLMCPPRAHGSSGGFAYNLCAKLSFLFPLHGFCEFNFASLSAFLPSPSSLTLRNFCR